MSDGTPSEAGNEGRQGGRTSYRPTRLQHGDYIPEGSIRMSKQEVVAMQRKMLHQWQPQSDVWPFRLGGAIVSTCTAITGLLVNNHFRRKFLLRNYGYHQTLIPVIIFPSVTAIALEYYRQSDVLTLPDCPTCSNIRAGVTQVACSVGYSCILAPILCMKTSKQYHTYVISKYSFKPNVYHALKTKQSAVFGLLGLIWINFAVGFFVNHMQGKTLEDMTITDAKRTAERLLN